MYVSSLCSWSLTWVTRNAKLAALKEATGPGGQYHDSEVVLGESMRVWQELFKAASALSK